MTNNIGEFFQAVAINAYLQVAMVIALTCIVFVTGLQELVLHLQFLLQR